jgi:hypothetical protein
VSGYRHWTCEHGAAGIRADGIVRPNPHPYLGVALSWWSDLSVGDRFGLGLTMNYMTCDRMQAVFEADPGQQIVPWVVWARGRVAPETRWEVQQFGWPRHWFVAEQDITVSEVTA